MLVTWVWMRMDSMGLNLCVATCVMMRRVMFDDCARHPNRPRVQGVTQVWDPGVTSIECECDLTQVVH